MYGSLTSSGRVVLTIAFWYALTTPVAAQSISEGFDNNGASGLSFRPRLVGQGWAFTNNSTSPRAQGQAAGGGTQTYGPGWDNGEGLLFVAGVNSGNNESYAASSFDVSSVSGGTVDDWMILPTRTLRNGDTLRFITRTADRPGGGPDGPERMQVRLSANGASSNVGTTGAATPGDFTNLLLDINPTLVLNGPGEYPFAAWQQYVVTISGLAGPTSGRLAFRHIVTNSGLDDTFNGGPNGDVVGIDNMVYTPIPEPTSLAFVGVAVIGMAWRRRRMAAQS